MGKKGGTDTTTGYRYAFSILVGICRGPIDSIFLIKADGKVFIDTEITGNSGLGVLAPDLFGGDKGQGGLQGALSVYFGRFDQIIGALDYIRTVMAGLRLTQMRGVVTAFYDGEVCANDPYPKAWQYRVRRALKGWHNDECWYPEKAVIRLFDPSIATYSTDANPNTSGGYNAASSTTLVDANGQPTSDPTAALSTVTTTYTGQTVTSYTTGSGTTTTYNVPQHYNDIYAMNPAHIIYECATNPDWGRGLPRELMDHASFASSANTLYNEGFGLCMKWSQQEDIDAFVQNVIDHIGAAVYTNPVTGLLSLRLIRNDYDVSALTVYDYEHGLLEVTSVQTASSDAVANEVIVKYHSPVLDSDREARAQNIASINTLASFMTVTKDYSGIPTSTLALKAAARELKVNSNGWKRVEFKVDRRGYTLVPGDVIRLTAPDRGLNDLVVRVATIDQSQIKDGAITIVGVQDIFGWPLHGTQEPQMSTFQEINRYPMPVKVYNLWEATYRDMVKFAGSLRTTAWLDDPSHAVAQETCFTAIAAEKPNAVSMAYVVMDELVRSAFHPASEGYGWVRENSLNFTSLSRLKNNIGTTDTTFVVAGEITSTNGRIGGAYVICADAPYFAQHEYVRLDGISTNPTTGAVTLTVARGCVDTPAIPHPKGSRVWAVDESAGLSQQPYSYNDLIGIKELTHTVSMGDLDPALARIDYLGMSARSIRPYIGANFRVNGYPRDAMPAISGDLVLTWNHRNRLTQAEHLIGETEANIPPEPETYYGVFIQPTRSGPPSDGGASLNKYQPVTVRFEATNPFWHPITGDTVTIPLADLLTANTITGPMRITFQTMRLDPDHGIAVVAFTPVGIAFNQVTVDFDYVVDPVAPDTLTGGFGFDFDNNFDGG